MPLDDTLTQTSLSDLSALTESWRKLAYAMEPSQAPYSGAFSPTGTSSDAQWLRQMSLIVYGGQGASAAGPSQSSAVNTPGGGIELGALRVTFNVHKRTMQTPDILEAKVYNMAPATMQQVLQFNRVQLSAGYQFANFGMIFDGVVVQYRRGKENPTDTYLEIIAGDGDNLPAATSFRRFEAGTQESTAIKALVQDTGYPIGYIQATIGQQSLQRPWIVAGSTQQVLREMALKYNADYWVEKGQLYFVSRTGYLPGEAVVLAPTTGLVNIPELTPQGIQARCLLNPKLRLGGLVKLDNNLISGIPYYPGPGGAEMTGFQVPPTFSATGPAKFEVLPPTSPTGTYRICMIEISGDSRGQPWYDDLICVALDQNMQPLLGPQSAFYRSYAYAAPGSPGATSGGGT